MGKIFSQIFFLNDKPGYDPNLYEYKNDMPEVITDAKLGHLQKMLESIPYLDCCERQQRHLENLEDLDHFVLWKNTVD